MLYFSRNGTGFMNDKMYVCGCVHNARIYILLYCFVIKHNVYYIIKHDKNLSECYVWNGFCILKIYKYDFIEIVEDIVKLFSHIYEKYNGSFIFGDILIFFICYTSLWRTVCKQHICIINNHWMISYYILSGIRT